MFEPLNDLEDSAAAVVQAAHNPAHSDDGGSGGSVGALEVEAAQPPRSLRAPARRRAPPSRAYRRQRGAGVLTQCAGAAERAVGRTGLSRMGFCGAAVLFVLLLSAVALLGSINATLKREEGQKQAPHAGPVNPNAANPIAGWTVHAPPTPAPTPPFLTLLTTTNDTGKLLALVPAALTASAPNASTGLPNAPGPAYRAGAEFLVSAIYDRGTFVMEAGAEGEHASLLHMPADSTDFNVFTLAESPGSGGTTLDLRRSQLMLRAGGGAAQDSMRLAAEQGAWGGWLATLPVLAVRTKAATGAGGAPFAWSAASPSTCGCAAMQGASLLVDLSPLLAAGFFVSLPARSVSVRSARIAGAAAFATNSLLRAQFQVTSKLPGGTPYSLALAYSFTLLSARPMTPRVADDRVGYFTTHYTALGVRYGAAAASTTTRASALVDPGVTLINRRRFDAEQPVLRYYIDPSVPPRWRAYLKAGVERWQPAFEAAGLGPAAVRAVLPGDADWPADYHAADTRYDSISWAVDVEQTYALGPSTVDPRSGEIIDANIVFTNGWIASWLRSFERYHPAASPGAAANAAVGADDAARAHTRARGGRRAQARSPQVAPGHYEPCGAGRVAPGAGARGADISMSARCHQHRSFAPGGGAAARAAAAATAAPLLQLRARARRRAAAAAATATTAAPGAEPIGDVPEAVVGAGLTDVTMHEVGHTLGLRHNFIASVNRTLAQLHDPAFIARYGLADSVMDYLPVAILSEASGGVAGGAPPQECYFTPTIGQYDMWAIRWGYGNPAPTPTTPPPGGADAIVPIEPPSQLQLAATGLPFASDYDVADANPYTNRFDLGEPLWYYLDRLQLARELQPGLLDSAVRAGESWVGLLPAVRTLLRVVQTAGVFLAKYVGGVGISRAWRAAGAAPPPALPVTPAPAAQQRAALDAVISIVNGSFPAPGGAPSIFPPAELQRYLVQREGECDALQNFCMGLGGADLVQLVHGTQTAVLKALITPARLRRLRTSELLGDAGALGIAETLDSVTSGVWGAPPALPLAQDKGRWYVQRFWLRQLLALAGNSTVPAEDADVAAHATAQLLAVRAGIDAVLAKPGAAAGAAYGHLSAARITIVRWQGPGPSP